MSRSEAMSKSFNTSVEVSAQWLLVNRVTGKPPWRMS
jgi:hypothetical protein